MNPDQVTALHRSRLAYVYIRQSSQHQVLHHQESQRRQRDLKTRATALGWPDQLVCVIDEDLGRTAARGHQRSGFAGMVAEVALGKAGMILALEASRLTRGNRDWYHLLDICAVTGTLIGDAEGLYNPRDYNDRLLLGLKGTMSEAELHVMKQRLVEAMRAKAKRGEFRFRPPPGYTWDEARGLQKSSDDQIRSTIELIFQRFQEVGTVHRVHGHLTDEGIEVPVYGGRDHPVRWKLPDYGYLRRLLKNPLYAGAYAYGQRQQEEVLDGSQRPRKRMRRRPREEWHVLIKDHHPGYISWDTFEKNQRQIAANRRGQGHVGAPGEGESLLQGLVLCGHCGRRMSVAYSRRSRLIRYSCAALRNQTGGPVCQSFGSKRLENAVEGLLLEALDPLGVEAMIAAAAKFVQADREEDQHWLQRVERARYHVDHARRQYDAVDPANRLVASELERRWETALEDLKTVEQEAEQRMKNRDAPLTEKEHRRLSKYAHDLPALWAAPTTHSREKKRITRCLIESVVVTVPKKGPTMTSAVHWKGGLVSTIELPKGRSGIHRHVADDELVQLVRTLAREFSDEQIARILSRKGIKTPKGLPFTAHRVSSMRSNHQIPGHARTDLHGPEVYTAERAAEILEVSHPTVIRWVDAGLLKGSHLTSGAPWRVRVTEEERKRLTTGHAPEGWLPLKGAARALGVSQQTVLQRLKDGKLEGIRVQVGRRSGWRINVPATTCDDHPTLFD